MLRLLFMAKLIDDPLFDDERFVMVASAAEFPKLCANGFNGLKNSAIGAGG